MLFNSLDFLVFATLFFLLLRPVSRLGNTPRLARDWILEDMAALCDRSGVDEEIVNRFLDLTRGWSSEGIAIFAFRPPSCPELTQLESEACGLDEVAFVRRFEDAGGRWLDPEGDYPTYDCAHLESAAAVRFSEGLALEIERVLEVRPKSLVPSVASAMGPDSKRRDEGDAPAVSRR
ncbi:MAG: hypothetical protein PVF68_16880 [Acidobacteriota bacterium]|jgi:hypothetical protein